MDIEQILAEEELENFPPVVVEPNFASTIIVDCLPVVPRDKEAKLVTVIKKIFETLGTIKDFYMPFIDESKSYGFAFIEYSSPMEAAAAVKTLDNHKLDQKHVFRVNHYEDFKVADSAPSEYVPPAELPFDTEVEDVYSYLLEPNACDQFLLRYGEETEIMWNGVGGSAPRSELKRSKWIDTPASWSPLGTYLVQMHKHGVILNGGPSFKKLRRFKHPSVARAAFSPCEKFLITYSEAIAMRDSVTEPEAFLLWDVSTGLLLGGFDAYKVEKEGQRLPQLIHPDLQINAFGWQCDDKIFTRARGGLVWVYDTAALIEAAKVEAAKPGGKKLLKLEGKPIKLAGPVKEISWSPADPHCAVFIPENNNIPGKIIVLELPSQKLVGQTTIFNVNDASLFWQDKGDFLAVKADRHRKNKKQTFTSFEVFRLREKGCPVESTEIEDALLDIKWELRGGKRLAIIHGATSTATRTTVTFYSLESKGIKVTAKLENRPANSIFWSPAGRYCLLAGLKALNGVFEFYDPQTNTSLTDELKHYLCTNVEWDPTGRFVTSFVSYSSNKNENGFKIWSWSGKEQFSLMKSPLHQFLWRPRPPSLLSKEQTKWLNSMDNFKTFQDKYKQQDRANALARFEAERKKRDDIRQAYRRAIGQRRKDAEADVEWRKNMGIRMSTEDDFYVVEEIVEEVIFETEEIEA